MKKYKNNQMIENRKCKNYAKFIGTSCFIFLEIAELTPQQNSFKLCKDKLTHMFQIMIILFFLLPV